MDYRIRSNYFEKLGVKGVEEKKSLEILLKEQSLDLEKLTQFCLKFPVPATYRIYLWKLLLGVLPRYPSSHEFVIRLHREQYKDLKETLLVTRRIKNDTPHAEVHLYMFLIDQGKILVAEDGLLQSEESQAFMAISNVMEELADDATDVYLLTTKFFKHQDDFKPYFQLMTCVEVTLKETIVKVDKVLLYLSKEESDDRLVTHLRNHQVLTKLPLQQWFKNCFAKILPYGCYERIWDKVIAGSCVVLVFVCVALLQSVRDAILNMKSINDIVTAVCKLSEESGERIVSRSIDLWQKHGSILVPCSESSSSTDKGH